MTTPKRGLNTRTWIVGALILVAGTLGFAGALSLVSSMQQISTDPQPTLLTNTAEVIVQPVGRVVDDRFAVSYDDSPREIVITYAGATYIQPFLENIDIAPGDTVVIASPDGVQRYTYDSASAGQWAYPIDGDTAVVTLTSSGGDHAGHTGVLISRVGQGFSATEFAQSLCGSNDLADVACSASSFPIEYGLRQPVARLFYTNGGGQYVPHDMARHPRQLHAHQPTLYSESGRLEYGDCPLQLPIGRLWRRIHRALRRGARWIADLRQCDLRRRAVLAAGVRLPAGSAVRLSGAGYVCAVRQ
ncbi:MAG: hypothetical protein HND48_12320 [Chloroflexi bacterium]|nr:hypothetical protein [Chloroflexota bacterium]